VVLEKSAYPYDIALGRACNRAYYVSVRYFVTITAHFAIELLYKTVIGSRLQCPVSYCSLRSSSSDRYNT
jgi:hypothetical protein